MRLRTFALGLGLCFFSAYCTEFVGGSGFGMVAADGAACSNNGDCASYSCQGGRCVAPAGGLAEIDQPCGSCVADATCQDGICVQTCGGEGQSCTAGLTNCCAGFTCSTLSFMTVCSNGLTSGGGGQGTGAGPGTGGSLGTGGSPNCQQTGNGCMLDTDCCSGSCDTINMACN